MNIIDGAKIAQNIIERLKSLPKPKKFLAAIMVGQDPISLNFLKIKEKIAQELDIDFRLYQLPTTIKNKPINNDYLRREILKLSKPKNCGGVIVQLPLPPPLNQNYILNVIPPTKDIDVLAERSLGSFYNNRLPILPPPAAVVEEILKTYNLDSEIKTLKVTVVGLGFLIGKPVTLWLINQKIPNICLIQKNGDLTKIHQADVVITGTGSPHLIKPAMLKEKVLVIDFGYSVINGKITGDFDSSDIENGNLKIENLKYTPTPGGTGPILVAKLFENFYKLNQSPLEQ